MTRPSDKQSFRALVRYYGGALVGQAVGRSLHTHPNASEREWLSQVAAECQGQLDVALSQLGEGVNEEVALYAREHLMGVLNKAPQMRKALFDHVQRVGGLDKLGDFKEALNAGVVLGKKLAAEGGEDT